MTQDKLEKFYETQAAWLHYRKQQGDSPTPQLFSPSFSYCIFCTVHCLIIMFCFGCFRLFVWLNVCDITMFLMSTFVPVLFTHFSIKLFDGKKKKPVKERLNGCQGCHLIS